MRYQLDEAWQKRFWSKVAVGGDDDCWPWTRGGNSDGHGCARVRSTEGHTTTIRANRAALILHTGEDSSERFARLSCGNKRCCNPRHGYWWEPDRHGETNPNAKLTWDDVNAIRTIYATGGVTQRQLSHKFDVTQSSISQILSGKRWAA